MYIEGTTIHNEGVDLKLEHQLRIRQISQMVRALSQAAEINMKLLKGESTHEVLLWGTVNALPLGIYCRGISLGQALDSTVKKVTSYCAKTRALLVRRKSAASAQGGEHSRLAMAS